MDDVVRVVELDQFGFKGYSVDNFGTVYDGGDEVRQLFEEEKFMVRLRNDNMQWRTVSVSKLLACAFLGKEWGSKTQVRFADGNPTNLEFSNLTWPGKNDKSTLRSHAYVVEMLCRGYTQKEVAKKTTYKIPSVSRIYHNNKTLVDESILSAEIHFREIPRIQIENYMMWQLADELRMCEAWTLKLLQRTGIECMYMVVGEESDL